MEPKEKQEKILTTQLNSRSQLLPELTDVEAHRKTSVLIPPLPCSLAPCSDHSSGLAVHCGQLETLHSFSVLVFEPTETLPKPKDAIQSFGEFQASIPQRQAVPYRARVCH